MSERSSSVDSNWCYVAQPGNGTPSTAKTKSPPSEDENDPELQSLIEKSKRLKDAFKQASKSYGFLKKDLRGAGDLFDSAYRIRDNHTGQALVTQEIGTISADTLRAAQEELSAGKYRKREFFGHFIMYHESILEQLVRLLSENNTLTEDLKRLELKNEEHQDVVGVQDLLHSQKNLNFLIHELSEEISAVLSSKLHPRD